MMTLGLNGCMPLEIIKLGVQSASLAYSVNTNNKVTHIGCEWEPVLDTLSDEEIGALDKQTQERLLARAEWYNESCR